MPWGPSSARAPAGPQRAPKNRLGQLTLLLRGAELREEASGPGGGEHETTARLTLGGLGPGMGLGWIGGLGGTCEPEPVPTRSLPPLEKLVGNVPRGSSLQVLRNILCLRPATRPGGELEDGVSPCKSLLSRSCNARVSHVPLSRSFFLPQDDFDQL